MAFYNPNVQLDILKAIEAENVFEVPLTLDNILLSDFVHGANSSTVMVDGVRYSGLKSFRRVTYHRISIVDFFKNVRLIMEAPEALTTKDLLPQLEATYGLSLSEDDIVDKPISWLDPELDYVYEFTLEIKPNHPLYFGTVKVSVSGILMDIERILVVTDVDAIKDGSPHVTNQQAVTMTTYGIDYTAQCDWLQDEFADWTTVGSEVTIDAAVAKELSVRLAAVDGQPWTFDTAAKPFNLNGARIVAHTRTKTYTEKYPATAAQPNDEYLKVLVLRPSALDKNNTWSNYWGYFLHYNVIARID